MGEGGSQLLCTIAFTRNYHPPHGNKKTNLMSQPHKQHTMGNGILKGFGVFLEIPKVQKLNGRKYKDSTRRQNYSERVDTFFKYVLIQ